MKDYCLMTDSCCDMDADTARDLDLTVLPLSVQLDGNTYRNWLDGREISFRDFYARVRAGAQPTSSAVSVGDFEAEMRRALEADRDVLCVCFASALSSTYQSAVIAAEHLRPEFPDRRIEVTDSRCASGGQGLLLYLCGQKRRDGASFQELFEYEERVKGQVCHWFTVDDLNHLKRGGRINAATALFGTMLSIKPILHVDEAGRLISMDKARGRRAAIQALADRFAATAFHPAEDPVFITHGDCREDADILAEELRRRFGTKEILISYVGPVIGSHTGAGVLTIMFLGQPR